MNKLQLKDTTCAIQALVGEYWKEYAFNLETPFWKPRKAYYYSKQVLQERASEGVGVTGCPQTKPVSYALPVGVVI